MNHVVAITHVDMVKSIKLSIRTGKTVTCFQSVSETDELLGFSSTANSRVSESDSKK